MWGKLTSILLTLSLLKHSQGAVEASVFVLTGLLHFSENRVTSKNLGHIEIEDTDFLLHQQIIGCVWTAHIADLDK